MGQQHEPLHTMEHEAGKDASCFDRMDAARYAIDTALRERATGHGLFSRMTQPRFDRYTSKHLRLFAEAWRGCH